MKKIHRYEMYNDRSIAYEYVQCRTGHASDDSGALIWASSTLWLGIRNNLISSQN